MTGSDSSAGPLNVRLLNQLRTADGEYVPLDALGSDPDRVRADLDALGSFGFAIERHPYRGAAYAGPADRLCPDQIEHELGTDRIGPADRRLEPRLQHQRPGGAGGRLGVQRGLVVLAEEQSAGRGRRGRSWMAPPRSSILMSVLLFPPPDLAPDRPRRRRGLRLADRDGRRRDRRGRRRLDRPRGGDQVAQRRPR